MTEKTDVQVVIDNKVMTISGYESEEYIQKIASYINNLLAEYNKIDAFRHSNKDIQHRLIEVNIADEYFKTKDELEKLQAELKVKEEKLYDLKHEVINKDMIIKTTKETLSEAEDKLKEYNNRIVQLETLNKNRK